MPGHSVATGSGSKPRLRSRSWRSCDEAGFVFRWDALARRACEPNPFFESWFMLPSLRALDPLGDVRLLTLEHDGELLGLMPIQRHAGYYGYLLPHWRNWVHTNAFCGQPLVAPGAETLFWREMLRWCDRHAGVTLFLHLTAMPATGPLHDALQALLCAQHRAAATVMAQERAMLCSTLSPEQYLEAAIPAKKRKELRRQERRLAERGKLEVRAFHQPVEVACWAGRFLALEAAGWKGRNGSALLCDQSHASLFHQALVDGAGAGRVQCLSLCLDGADIAMLVTFIGAPGAYSYKTTFDERYARYSPGVLLQCANLDLLDRPDLAWIDSCAEPDHAMIDHIWRERRAISRHSLAIGGKARRALFGMLARYETGRVAGGIS